MSKHTHWTPCRMKMFDQTMFSCLAIHHCFWWTRCWMKTFQQFSGNFMVVLSFSVWNYLRRCRCPFVVSSLGAHVWETRSGWQRNNWVHGPSSVSVSMVNLEFFYSYCKSSPFCGQQITRFHDKKIGHGTRGQEGSADLITLPLFTICMTVSYTHLTLPTKLEV